MAYFQFFFGFREGKLDDESKSFRMGKCLEITISIHPLKNAWLSPPPRNSEVPVTFGINSTRHFVEHSRRVEDATAPGWLGRRVGGS